jgi:IS5 family transposase
LWLVRRKNGELADLAETAAEAKPFLRDSKRAPRKAQANADGWKAEGRRDAAAGCRRVRLARAVNGLTELLEGTRQIVDQSRQRRAGTTPDGATRRVNLHDPDVRPIRNGRLGKPVEFGHEAQVCDNQDGS